MYGLSYLAQKILDYILIGFLVPVGENATDLSLFLGIFVMHVSSVLCSYLVLLPELPMLIALI